MQEVFSQKPLVTAAWLAAHLEQPDLRIVDSRWRGDGSGPDRYREGHVPGAVHLSWDVDLCYRHGRVHYRILPADRFARVMAGAGIGDETFVVVYADQDYSGAARMWWALRYYGHEQVAVLDGGWDAWLAGSYPANTVIPDPGPARFTARPNPSLLATQADVARAVEAGSEAVQLVDTRPGVQYDGDAVWTPDGSLHLPAGREDVEVDGRRMRGGRLPGAVHLNSSDNMDPERWTYLAPDELAERAAAKGLDPELPTVTYCGAGISASNGLFALYIAGFRNLALYDGSWEEWATDPSTPIERGPQSTEGKRE